MSLGANSSYRGKIVKLERRQNDTHGNPRWRILLEDGASFNTEDGFSVNFRLTWTEYLNEWAELRLNPQRRVIDVVLMPGPEVRIVQSEREDKIDAVEEALQAAAEAFPSDIPGQSLVKEWLTERAEKYRTGELVIP